jgi:hypothetical protein
MERWIGWVDSTEKVNIDIRLIKTFRWIREISYVRFKLEKWISCHLGR